MRFSSYSKFVIFIVREPICRVLLVCRLWISQNQVFLTLVVLASSLCYEVNDYLITREALFFNVCVAMGLDSYRYLLVSVEKIKKRRIKSFVLSSKAG